MEKTYEFFKKQISVTGKHANMAKAIWQKDNGKESYFRRFVDLYKLAPVVGYLADRKAEKDMSFAEDATVFLEQVLKEREELETILQMLLMVEYTDCGRYTQEEAVKKVFRGPKTEEEFKECMDLFDGYVRGGIEVLYEELITKGTSHENPYSAHLRTGAIMEFLEKYGTGKWEE